MVFAPNTSPLAGQEGKHLTAAKIGERLHAEAATSVSLQVPTWLWHMPAGLHTLGRFPCGSLCPVILSTDRSLMPLWLHCAEQPALHVNFRPASGYWTKHG